MGLLEVDTSASSSSASSSSSSNTFSQFAQSAQARQRAVEPPKIVSAVYVFLREIGKIYVEDGTEYTFHLPFIVIGAWALRPHGVLIQRVLDIDEYREAARQSIPLLPTQFTIHDPFAEPKPVGIAERIHGAFNSPDGVATAVTQADPDNLPETKTPDDFSTSSGYKPVPVQSMYAEPPPPPPKSAKQKSLVKPSPTDRILWVSNNLTPGKEQAENFLLSCTIPDRHQKQPAQATPEAEAQTKGEPGVPPPKPIHKYANQLHLTLWRYAYLKPKEVPETVTSKRKKGKKKDKVNASASTQTQTQTQTQSQSLSQSQSTSRSETPASEVSTPQPQRDPEAVRRRELQDRADRIGPPLSPFPGAIAPAVPAFPPPTVNAALRQQVGQQPTLTSLPGGELPASWGPAPQQQPQILPGHERKASQGHTRQPSQGKASAHVRRTSMNFSMIGLPGDEVDDGEMEKEKEEVTMMDAGHMKVQPAVWLEKIAAVPMPYTDVRHPDKISVHIFDTRTDGKLDRCLFALHFPLKQVLSVYTLVRVPAEDTFRLYPAVHFAAVSAVTINGFRGRGISDLVIVKPDGKMAILTHGIRLVEVKMGPRPYWLEPKETKPGPGPARRQPQADDDAMSVDDSLFKGDATSDTSMNSIIDKEKVVSVSHPVNNTFSVHFEDGVTTRTKLMPPEPDELTQTCFHVLSFALTPPRAFQLHVDWMSKWEDTAYADDNEQAWTCFVNVLCGMFDIDSPYLNLAKERHKLQPGSWEALAFTASHDRFQDDCVLEMLDAPFRTKPLDNKPPRKPTQDAEQCLFALHLLAESYKINNDAVQMLLPRLARLLITLGRAVRPEWADYWVRMFPENAEGWMDPKREDQNAGTRLRPQPPDVFLYLFSRLIEPAAKPGWTHVSQSWQVFGIEPSMQYGRVDPVKDLYRVFNVWECFTDTNVKTARKRAEQAMHLMVKMGMSVDDLDRMPHGLVEPIREALRTCQTLPGGDWSAEEYKLVLRPDMAQMVNGDKNHVTSRDSFKQVDKHLDPSGSRLTIGELVQDIQKDMSSEPVSATGVELELGDFTDIRFGSDRRLLEVARMLQSSSPATVRMQERPDLSEHDIAREQHQTAVRVVERTLALPVGRAMFTFGSVPTVTRDAYRIPKIDYTVRIQPYNAPITLDITKMNQEAKNWADFHNGVATGLRMSPSSKMVDSSWITFNKPAELTAEHAGFLFGLGLSGHLKNMLTWHTFSYLTPKHDLTSIGVLLGLSAANVGTANRHVTKLLAVSTPALLPNPTVDLNIPMLTQAAGLVGTGLLYMGTKTRRMAEMTLHEISRTQITTSDQTTDHREAYTLSAALAFGMIMLGAGATSTSQADANMISRLRLLIHGEPALPGITVNKPSFDPTLTSAPATLALALMFLRTGRQDIADILLVPNTLLELHHLQPSLLLVRTLGRALIMWDKVAATPQWVTDQLPKNALQALEKTKEGHPIDESLELAYFNIVSGACFAMGLKYAGTAQEDPYSCLIHFHDLFTRIWNQNIGQFAHRIKRAAVRDGLNLISLALSMVMAGTGEINCLRRFRYAHGQATQPNKYGVHMATHMAIGMLFLGGGRYTLGTSDCAIACLVAAFYPRFPTLSHENRGQLQALRHLWVLAVEPRCLIGRDVESNEVVYLPVKVKLLDGKQNRSAQLISPTLFPDINRLTSIRVDNPRYFPFVLDISGNARHREVLLSNQTLWVKRRTGHLGYGEDPRGSRSIYVRSGASSGDAAVLDNPKASDARSPSAIEFYQFMSSFSNEAFFVSFADRFCRVAPEGDTDVDEEELVFSAYSQAAMLECLTLDRAHILPTYLAIHLTRQRAGTGWNAGTGAGCSTLSVRDLTWLDEFYKNIYDTRFSGKADNAALPPLIRRPLPLGAERNMELRLRALRQDPDLRIALRRYHRGEGIVFPVATSSAEHKAQRVEAQTTLQLMASHGSGGEEAVKGLLWNTGVLFAGGILRPWSMRSLGEVIESWDEEE
ncbi:hypothetical protein M422DRAFT_77064 [Sphaerobolus stellatus SS14]|uniref:Uncharacterized protein n=1 Tax=Sphaerobolus stellatus (strain SS14) TaxID=990650 RepID=A0A0C9TV20_SPHS4|nr:hypothetical protein M422DRAFT_77064 [Sphaerobolus stellatus SS14]